MPFQTVLWDAVCGNMTVFANSKIETKNVAILILCDFNRSVSFAFSQEFLHFVDRIIDADFGQILSNRLG